jgi:hypothetical protein
VPSSRLTAGLTVSGRKQAAAAIAILLHDDRAVVQRRAVWKIVTIRS